MDTEDKEAKKPLNVQGIKAQVTSDLERAKQKNDELVERTKNNIADLLCFGNAKDSNDEFFQQGESTSFGPPLFKAAYLDDVHIKALQDFQDVENATRNISEKTRKELMHTMNVFFTNPAGQKTNEELESEEFIKEGLEGLKEKILNDIMSTKRCTDVITEKTRAQLAHMNHSEIHPEVINTNVQQLLSFSVKQGAQTSPEEEQQKQQSSATGSPGLDNTGNKTGSEKDKETYGKENSADCKANSADGKENSADGKEISSEEGAQNKDLSDCTKETTTATICKVYDQCVAKYEKFITEDKKLCDQMCETQCETLK